MAKDEQDRGKTWLPKLEELVQRYRSGNLKLEEALDLAFEAGRSEGFVEGYEEGYHNGKEGAVEDYEMAAKTKDGPHNQREAVELVGVTLCYALASYNDDEISRDVMDCYRDTFASEILSLITPDKPSTAKDG